jgi:uroporphyrin-III C-methyltransferase
VRFRSLRRDSADTRVPYVAVVDAWPVQLVGAGPGGADLITVRGARVLAQAEVIVVDRLVDPALLDYATPTAEVVDVGKCKGAGPSQDEINTILVTRARAGKRVVRLKGGDPFVFGRGAEEIDALVAAGLAYEIVPGLTSALAAPALAGIAVTERGLAASVTIVSGHRVTGASVDWRALTTASDTLVVLMGATTAADIAARLLGGGAPDDLPAAVCHRAGTADAITTVTSLGRLATAGSPHPSPSVLVIGAVAARARTAHLVAERAR